MPSFKRDTTQPDDNIIQWDTQHWHNLENKGKLVSRKIVEQAINHDHFHDFVWIDSGTQPIPFVIEKPLNTIFDQMTIAKANAFPVILTAKSAREFSPPINPQTPHPLLADKRLFRQFFSFLEETTTHATNHLFKETLDDLDEALKDANALAPSNEA